MMPIKPFQAAFVGAACLMLLIACNRQGADAGRSHGGGLAKDERPDMIWIEPLVTCSTAQVATIHWTKKAVESGPARLLVGESEGAPVFAEIAEPGSKKTGEWSSPGMVVVLKGVDGKLRAKAIARGPDDCA